MVLIEIIAATILLIAFIDPFVSLAALLSIHRTQNIDIPQTVMSAIAVAGVLMLLFILVGTSFLDFFGISMGAFKIGGGIIILILGLQNVLGIEFNKQQTSTGVAVVIGTPLVAGPGVATTLMLLRAQHGIYIPLVASVFALIVTSIILLSSKKIENIFGRDIILVFSRVVGLLLCGFAAQLVLDGVKTFFS